MSGALLQILLQGEEDKHLSSEGFDAFRPFRQVYRRQTLFCTELVDIDARFPSELTYGQTLSNIQIPRKGDLLRRVVIGMKVKRASGTTQYPAIELIDEVSLWCGKLLLERVRGEYIWVKNHTTETAEGMACVRRLTGFLPEETKGTVKQLYVEVPFFTAKTPLPLIAMQLQNLHLELKLKNAPVSLDPTYQPDVDVLCEFCMVDDDERRYFSQNTHELLIERVLTQDDGIVMRKSQVQKLYTPVTESLGSYDRVTGSGVGETINLGDRLRLVNNPAWTGRTDVIWDTPANAARYDLRGRFLLPLDGSMGMGWASVGDGTGYGIDFSVIDSLLTMRFSRDGGTLCVIANNRIESNAYTTVTGETTSTDYSAQQNAGEAWLVLDTFFHDLELDTLTIRLVVEGYVAGGYFADLPPVNSIEFNYVISEGMTAIQTADAETQMSVYGDSVYDVFYVPEALIIQTVQSVPTIDNYQVVNKQYFFRGPSRYVLWWYRPASGWEFGRTSTDVVDGETIRHDIMSSARLLLNGKERCRDLPSQFFSTLEPKRVFGKALPAGVHVFGFSEGSVDEISPSGTLNISRVGNFTIQHTLRSYSDTDTTVLSRLDESETLRAGRTFDTIMCCSVGYNVVYIENGRLSLAYM